MSRKSVSPPPFDPTIKTIVEIAPPDWVRVFDQPLGPTKVVDSDVATTIRGAADKVIRVAAKPPYLLHLDFQAGHFAAQMPSSLHLRNVALQHRHRMVVVAGLVLLRPEADSPQWSGLLRSARPGQEPETTFRYRVLRVWQQPPEMFLEGVGTLPLAPVSAVTNAKIPEIIREVKARLAGHPLAPDLWAATYVMLGLRHSNELAATILRGVLAMKESVTYQAIVAEGKAEGLIEGARQLLLHQGTSRFGAPSKAYLAQMNRINDLARLQELGDRIMVVDSWRELLDANGATHGKRRSS